MSQPKQKSGWIARWIKRLLVLGILGGGGYYAWLYFTTPADQTITYRTAAITRGKLTQVVTATGQISALVTVQVGSQISGTLEKINADFNSPVKEGDVIAELDAATYRAVVAQGEGDLANARATLELARLNAERKKELREQKLSPAADYDKAIADLHQAEALEQTKMATVDRAKVDLRRCTILAPIDGIVISRKVDVGQTVAASLNAPVLFEIANDLSKMQIHTQVAEADVGGVAQGQKVDFSVDAFPDRTFHGIVEQVRNAPTKVDNVVTYDALIALENADLKLKPGMTATVYIIIAEKEDALLVSNAALRWKPPVDKKDGEVTMDKSSAGGRKRSEGKTQERTPEKTIYLAAEAVGGKPTPVSVTTGITDSIKTEVLTGLMENQQVITGIVPPATSTPAASPFGGPGRR